MRRRVIHNRPTQSIVQQTATANVRSLFKDLILGNPIDLKTNGVPGSFDFDGVEVDWDKPLLTEAPNKIEQYLNREKYLQKDKVVQSKPPVSDPPAPDQPE